MPRLISSDLYHRNCESCSLSTTSFSTTQQIPSTESNWHGLCLDRSWPGVFMESNILHDTWVQTLRTRSSQLIANTFAINQITVPKKFGTNSSQLPRKIWIWLNINKNKYHISKRFYWRRCGRRIRCNSNVKIKPGTDLFDLDITSNEISVTNICLSIYKKKTDQEENQTTR